MNSKGQEIFCKSWLPKPGVRIKAAVWIAKRIAASGYGVYAIDHPGFGLSKGLHGYITNFGDLVDNAIEQYIKIKEWLQALPSALVVGFVKTDIEFQQKGKWEFGFVYKAQMTTTVQTVAVKVLATDSNKGIKSQDISTLLFLALKPNTKHDIVVTGWFDLRTTVQDGNLPPGMLRHGGVVILFGFTGLSFTVEPAKTA
ncbi:hypothetical protein L2E82_47960 [Cichorium intybus]|uniref:Uncharacterized protein n=1 Tax=Cichorium intybus TaxID=13427 RepID=A0ACB8YWU6_CICIN|nr:hypothetical protein L2E82_47960 [Cichorium intybus]